MVALSNLTPIESQAMSALVVGGQTANLLTPVAATSAAVSDILAAAGEVVRIGDTTNAALANFNARVNDPITTSFSTGQPYGGAFITASTVSQITPVNFDRSLSSSTQTLSRVPPAQARALSARTDVVITSDADLATAMAVVFANTAAEFKQAFSIDLTDDAAITPVRPGASSPGVGPVVVAIPPVTLHPDLAELSAFVSQVATSFGNVEGLAGVVASVWVGGLGMSVNVFGASVTGIPKTINRGIYGDIVRSANDITQTAPIDIVDYGFQQNRFNLTVALAIDHGLTGTLTSLMTSSLVSPVTHQVITNRLASVASRGDAAMLATMFTLLGVTAIPDPESLLTILLGSLRPSDRETAAPPPVTVASGITIATTANPLTTAQLLSHITTMLTTASIPAPEIFHRNTCDSILCSQPLVNVRLVGKTPPDILATLLDPTTVRMARMFDA